MAGRQISKTEPNGTERKRFDVAGWGKYLIAGAVLAGFSGYGAYNAIRHPHVDREYMNSRTEADKKRDEAQGRERKNAAETCFRRQREYSEHRAESDRRRDEAYRNRNMNYRVESEAKNKADAGMDK